MSTFGYYPGAIDYWMLLTDWRNGSIAILLALFVYALACRSPTAVELAHALPEHPSPAISGDNAIDDEFSEGGRERRERV
jgi:hypothetical protein